MTRRKTAVKTARPSPLTGKSLPVGNHPGNTGGKKGRSGRRPAAFKNFLARLRQNPKLHQALRDALTDPESKGFPSALKVLTDYDEEKPSNKVDVTSGGNPVAGVVMLPLPEEPKDGE